MATKPAKRNWNDVQTAIATATIVTTLGMWNLFAAPVKAEGAETVPTEEAPTLPPTATPIPARPPFEGPVMPTKVKVMFTQIATPDTTVVQQSQSREEQRQKKKKKKDHGGSSGGGGGGGGGSAPAANTGSS